MKYLLYNYSLDRIRLNLRSKGIALDVMSFNGKIGGKKVFSYNQIKIPDSISIFALFKEGDQVKGPF